MEQKTTATPPQWDELLREWQKEDSKRRAVFAVAIDEKSIRAVAMGSALHTAFAIFDLIRKDETLAAQLKAALMATENPVARLRLVNEWTEYARENSIPVTEEKSDTSDILGRFKDFLKLITDKL